MLEQRDRSQDELFVACSLSDLVPEDYILKRVDRVLDLSWLRAEVEDLYCEDNGRPGIDPEAAVRLMLAGFFHGIVHDRKLMREAQMHVGIRWFAGYALHDKLPDHSSLTRLRQRWGADRFRRIFDRTVQACIKAGLVSGQTVHIDATLIRADVSWESLVEVHANQVLAENAPEGPPESDQSEPPKTLRNRTKKRSKTDPDATLTTCSKDFRMSPSYKQHTAVDDQAGVVIDAHITTGEASEGSQLMEQIDRIEERLGFIPGCITADRSYAHGMNFHELERRNIEAVIPPVRIGRTSQVFPQSRFKYDEYHDIVRCPAGRKLRRRREGGHFLARPQDCRACKLRHLCLRDGTSRQIILSPSYSALLRARRKHERRNPQTREKYRRHKWLVEGRHGEAKTQHGLHRAIRRRLENVQIQAYLTAAVMNLKRLAALIGAKGAPWRLLKGVLAALERLLPIIRYSITDAHAF